jgi:pimeloyl-ACP methyl ester carboxylesterase
MAAVREPIVGGYVHVPYGGYDYRVFYEEAGEGIPLVCLHTAGTDSREWRHQLTDPDINGDFRVIAFDLPRHGKSIPPVGFEKEDYRLTAKFYSEFLMAFCEALELDRPVIMGSSMGGNICLHLAVNFEERVRALIAIEACDYSPGWYLSWLHHPHVHGGEACATSVFGLMAPQSPDEYRWETWWYYSQGDFACTPEMTAETGKKIKGSETIIMEEIGHFPMSENPVTFKKYLMPVLEKVRAAGREPAGVSG